MIKRLSDTVIQLVSDRLMDLSLRIAMLHKQDLPAHSMHQDLHLISTKV